MNRTATAARAAAGLASSSAAATAPATNFLTFVSLSSDNDTQRLLQFIHEDFIELTVNAPVATFLRQCASNASLAACVDSVLAPAKQRIFTAAPSPAAHSQLLSIVIRDVFQLFARLASLTAAELTSLSLPGSFLTVSRVLDFALVYAHNNNNVAAVTQIISAVSTATIHSHLLLLMDAAPSMDASRQAPLLLTIYASFAALITVYQPLVSMIAGSPAFVVGLAQHYQFAGSATTAAAQQQSSRAEFDTGALASLPRWTMKLARIVLQRGFIQPLAAATHGDDSEQLERAFDGLYSLLINLNDAAPSFLTDFDALYQLRPILTSMQNEQKQSNKAVVEDERWKYLIDILPNVQALSTKLPATQLTSATKSPTAKSTVRSPPASSCPADETSLVSELCTLLDNAVSEDFAQSCLREYDGNLGSALQHIFDDTLPLRLQQVSKAARKHFKTGDTAGTVVGGLLEESQEDDAAFRNFLLRSGRVAKSSAPASSSALSVFADRTDAAILMERIIASTQIDSLYDDEFNDAYDELLTVPVHEGADEDEDKAVNVRDRWRREERAKDRARNEARVQQIETIAPSKRTEEEKRDYERLTQPAQLQPQAHHRTQNAKLAGPVRGIPSSNTLTAAAGVEPVSDATSSAISPSTRGGFSARARNVRGRGSTMVGRSFDEKEAERRQRFDHSQQGNSERDRRRARLMRGEDEASSDSESEPQHPDTEVQSKSMPSSSDADPSTGPFRAPRGRGAFGSGPRDSRAHSSSGRGQSHQRKAQAARKLNAGMGGAR